MRDRDVNGGRIEALNTRHGPEELKSSLAPKPLYEGEGPIREGIKPSVERDKSKYFRPSKAKLPSPIYSKP